MGRLFVYSGRSRAWSARAGDALRIPGPVHHHRFYFGIAPAHVLGIRNPDCQTPLEVVLVYQLKSSGVTRWLIISMICELRCGGRTFSQSARIHKSSIGYIHLPAFSLTYLTLSSLLTSFVAHSLTHGLTYLLT